MGKSNDSVGIGKFQYVLLIVGTLSVVLHAADVLSVNETGTIITGMCVGLFFNDTFRRKE